MGAFGTGERYEKGDRLTGFEEEHKQIKANTLFQKPKIRYSTCESPDRFVYLGVFPCLFVCSKTAPRCSDPGIDFLFCNDFEMCGLFKIFEFCTFSIVSKSISISSLSARLPYILSFYF